MNMNKVIYSLFTALTLFTEEVHAVLIASMLFLHDIISMSFPFFVLLISIPLSIGIYDYLTYAYVGSLRKSMELTKQENRKLKQILDELEKYFDDGFIEPSRPERAIFS